MAPDVERSTKSAPTTKVWYLRRQLIFFAYNWTNWNRIESNSIDILILNEKKNCIASDGLKTKFILFSIDYSC